MTPQQLITELKALRESATEGEWKPSAAFANTIVCTKDGVPVDSVADAKFVAASFNVLPTLLSYIESLERKAKAADELGKVVENFIVTSQTNPGLEFHHFEQLNDSLIAYREAIKEKV